MEMTMITEVRIRKQITDGGRVRYRAECGRENMTQKKLEELEAIKFRYTSTMKPRDIEDFKTKWGYRLSRLKFANSDDMPQISFMQPLKPSKELAEIVGSEEQPRTEIMKKVWIYIKKNNLQDAYNQRYIHPDAKLKALAPDIKSFSIFNLTRILSKHLS